jgi:hypothetical protein
MHPSIGIGGLGACRDVLERKKKAGTPTFWSAFPHIQHRGVFD